MQKETNCTTAESRDSDKSKYTLKQSKHTLSSQTLRCKTKYKNAINKLSDSKIRSPKFKIASPVFAQNTPKRVAEKLGVSHRFISLIEENQKDKRTNEKIDKPRTLQRISDITQKISDVYRRHSLNKIDLKAAKSKSKVDDGEENMVESPCPRPKVPVTASYRKSGQKSESMGEFKISPRLIGSNPVAMNEIYLNDQSSSDSEIFDRANSEDDEEYDLFSWCSEFDDICQGTHKDLVTGVASTYLSHEINLSEKPNIDPYYKYECLKIYMSYKTSYIRGIKHKLIDSVDENMDLEQEPRRPMHKKRNS